MAELEELMIAHSMQITSPNRDDCSACSNNGLWVALSSIEIDGGSETVLGEGNTPLEAARDLAANLGVAL